MFIYILVFVSFWAAPSQQPAPVGFALSYSSIHLSWHPPDSPNSHILNYTLIRDGQSVHTVQSRYPFSMYRHSVSHTYKYSLVFLLPKLISYLFLCSFHFKALNLLKTLVCLPSPTTLTGL